MPPASLSAVEFPALLAAARERVGSIQESDHFYSSCASNGISPTRELGSYRYWQQFSQFVGGMVMKAEAAGMATPLTAAIGLLASSPAFLGAQRSFEIDSVRHEDAFRAVRYQGLLRSFVRKYANVPVSLLRGHLVDYCQEVPMEGRIKKSAYDTVTQTSKSVQAHVTTERILSHLGWRHEETSPLEDLAGVDCKAWPPDLGPLYIDVKFSAANIRSYGVTDRNYAYRDDGVLIYTPGLAVEDYADRFTPTDDLVASRAPGLREAVEAAPILMTPITT